MLSKIEQYRHGRDRCVRNAELAGSLEFRQLWAVMASSYEFLRAREQRLETEDRERDASAIAARLPTPDQAQNLPRSARGGP